MRNRYLFTALAVAALGLTAGQATAQNYLTNAQPISAQSAGSPVTPGAALRQWASQKLASVAQNGLDPQMAQAVADFVVAHPKMANAVVTVATGYLKDTGVIADAPGATPAPATGVPVIRLNGHAAVPLD